MLICWQALLRTYPRTDGLGNLQARIWCRGVGEEPERLRINRSGLRIA